MPKLPNNARYASPRAVSGRLFFDDVDFSKKGRGLWTRGGTLAGTFKIRHIPELGKHGGQDFAAIGSRIYFTSAEIEGDVELWSRDF